MALVMGAHAQNPDEDEGSLATALNTFAASSDLEILFEPNVVMGLKAQPYDETASSLDVLNAMLAGTGLSASEAAPNVFIVAKAEIDEPAGTDPIPQTEPVADPVAAEPASSETPATGPIEGATDPGFIRGRIVDDGSDRALVGTIVTLLETGQTATTNSRGEYRFGAVLPGTYTMKIDYLGTGTSTEIVSVEAEETSVVDVRMPYFLGTVLVQSNRSSLSQALNQQRAAENNSTVVSADLLGSFPAENVSEALRRVSGVTFARDETTGEGQRITIRGFESEVVNVQVNGIQLNGTGIERGIDLTGIQGDNISQITIQKTLLPSQEATGTGGLVEIETKSGLDYGDRYLSFGVEGESGLESEFGDEYEFNATGAYKFTDDFGVVATLQYRDTDRSNLNTNYLQTNIPVLPAGVTFSSRIPPEFNYPFDEGLDGPLQTGVNYFIRDLEQTNLTGSLNFAWDVADHTSLRLDLQRIEREETVDDRRATQRTLTTSTNMPIPELGGEERRRTYIRSLAPTLGISEQTEEETIDVYSFRGDTSLGQWDLDYKLGFSETVRERQRDSVSLVTPSFLGNSDVLGLFQNESLTINPDSNATDRVVNGVVSVVGGDIPGLNLSQAGLDYIADPSTYRISSATRAQSTTPTEEWTAEFGSRYNFANSFLDYLEGGIQYTANERANSDDILSNDNLTSNQSYTRLSTAVTTLVSDLDGFGFDSVNLGFAGADNLNVIFPEAGSASEYLNAVENLLVDDPSTPDFNEARFRLDDNTGDPIEDGTSISPLTVTEDRLALYVQASATFNDFEIVGGGRYEELDTTGSAVSAPSIRLADNTLVDRLLLANLGIVDFFDSSATDDIFTPTLIANYRPREDVVLRFAWQQTTINPDIRQRSRPVQVIVNNRPTINTATLREPNPNLEPTVTDNFDFDVSYYFKDNPGLIRLGVFYKDVSNNFTNDILADEATQVDVEALIRQQLEPLFAQDPNILTFDDDTVFSLQRPRNGEGGTVYGAEFEIIRQLDFFPETWPGFLENVSVLGNLTWTDSDFPTDIFVFNPDTNGFENQAFDRPLSNQSEWAGNASVSYEEGGFSGRLIYTFQSESVRTYDEYNLNTVIPDFDTLDLRMQYTLEQDWGRTTFFLEGDNLLLDHENADIRTGTGSFGGTGSPDFFFPTFLQFNGGRTFTLGARVTF